MGDAVKKLWNLSEDEKIQEYMEAIEKQRPGPVGQRVLCPKRGAKKKARKIVTVVPSNRERVVTAFSDHCSERTTGSCIHSIPKLA